MKARPSTSKNTTTLLIATLTLLQWSGTKATVSLRFAFNSMFSFIFLIIKMMIIDIIYFFIIHLGNLHKVLIFPSLPYICLKNIFEKNFSAVKCTEYHFVQPEMLKMIYLGNRIKGSLNKSV